MFNSLALALDHCLVSSFRVFMREKEEVEGWGWSENSVLENWSTEREPLHLTGQGAGRLWCCCSGEDVRIKGLRRQPPESKAMGELSGQQAVVSRGCGALHFLQNLMGVNESGALALMTRVRREKVDACRQHVSQEVSGIKITLAIFDFAWFCICNPVQSVIFMPKCIIHSE